MTGLPSDWIGGVESVVVGAQSVGDPFNAGALVTFDGCVPWNEYGVVLLHTLRIIAAVPHADQLLSVVGAVPPIDAVHALPVVFRCGGSDPATYESAASEIQLNPSASMCHVDGPFPPPTCDLVSVESATWALVKALYD